MVSTPTNFLAFYSYASSGPGQMLRLPVRLPAMVFHLKEDGRVGQSSVGADRTVARADRSAAFHTGPSRPLLCPGRHRRDAGKLSASTPANLLLADESPLHLKLQCLQNPRLNSR